MPKYILTETVLRNIIRESVRKALNEGVYDTDDSDNEIYDLEPTVRFRFTWWIRKSEMLYKWQDVSEGQEEFQSEEEAIDAAKKVLTEAPKTAYAVKFNIERFIDTYSDGRWERIMNYDGCRVRDIIEGDEAITSIYERHPDVSESIVRRLVRESVDDVLSSIKDPFSAKNDAGQRHALKYETAVDLIDHYTWMVHDGHVLSREQCEQIEEAIDFLRQTDTGDNPETSEWIKQGTDLLSDFDTSRIAK